MKIIISLIGRSNVGKSTLFNILTNTKSAIVNELDNFTRDRKYGYIKKADNCFVFIDTPAIQYTSDIVNHVTMKQSILAIDESDVVFFILNAVDGIMFDDYFISNILRTKNKFIVLIINKVNILNDKNVVYQFYSLGFKNIYFIDSLNKRSIKFLFNKKIYPFIFNNINKYSINSCIKNMSSNNLFVNVNYPIYVDKLLHVVSNNIKLAFIGQPNVGKSTLINNILGVSRLTVNSLPGTTRDSIYIFFKRGIYNYIFMDTAGLKKIKKKDKYSFLDKYSMNQSIKSIDYADIILLVIDINLGFLDQDLCLLNLVLSKGKFFIIIVNKCEGISDFDKNNIRLEILNRIKFVHSIKIHFISALYKQGIDYIFNSIEDISIFFKIKFNSKYLTKILLDAVNKHCVPMINGYYTKLKYAHFGGHKPFIIIVHGRRIKYLSNSYKRYLINFFNRSLKLIGTTIIMKFKETKNPYIN